MPDQASGQKQAGPQSVQGHNWLISALLILFTLIVAFSCIVVLSTTLTQTRVATLTIDGVNVGIRKLDHVGRQWAKIPRRLEDQTRGLAKAQDSFAGASGRATATEITRKARRAQMEDLLVAFYRRVETADAPLAAQIHNRGYADQVGFIRAAKDRLHTAHPDFDGSIKSIEDTFEAMVVSDRDDAAAQAEKTGAKQQIDLLSAGIQNTQKTLTDIFNEIKPDIKADDRSRVENVLYELNVNNYDSGWVNRFTYRMLTMPPDLLTLCLVILMGILGSALQITHAYFMKNQVQTIGGYFQRISVGAMTALVIFIVAKAGVPVIADPSRLGGEAPINPYFVSFLAIVSGLLSENAIANVQAQGAKLFGGDTGEPNRWARHDLSPDLQAQNITVADLATYLGVDEESAGAMLKGEKAIEPQQQKIVTVCLRKDARELFTDIPPSKK